MLFLLLGDFFAAWSGGRKVQYGHHDLAEVRLTDCIVVLAFGLFEIAPKCIHAVEVVSGETVSSDLFKRQDYWRGALKGEVITPWVVYGGSAPQDRERGHVLPWFELEPMLRSIGET